MQLERFSFGAGDRFGQQAMAQLAAFQQLLRDGILVIPVWNKSNREHSLTGTEPLDVRRQADEAVRLGGWQHPYHVDADHISLKTVDRFIPACDFFTLDVADFIGKPAPDDALNEFIERHRRLIGTLNLPGGAKIEITEAALQAAAEKYLLAAAEAGRIYKRIIAAKPDVVIEVSADETDNAMTPAELLIFLAALAGEKVPLQTVAPKFSGQFNKGVDYAGDLAVFRREFELDLGVIAFAVAEFGLPDNLKLSVHSGSDKFSLYPVIRELTSRHRAGLHLKTAGTTWLEELAALAESGGDGLILAKEIYSRALQRFEEVCAPYRTVIDIDRSRLPSADEVRGWSAVKFERTLSHNPRCPDFNPHFRQLLHVSFKIAAEMGEPYLSALRDNRQRVAERVTANLYLRHMKPLFIG
ncbi:MAG: tagaturonate epimerase family protein [Verrucomicrobiae bacterium]|nr:tagaturonate epimerase family protein [Verrucomicrobiae bacterium]